MGFLAAVVFIVFSEVWSWGGVLFGTAIALCGLFLRGWAAGYLEKGKRLAQDGPYAIFRHPLYVGSFLIGFGFCWAGTTRYAPLGGILVWATFFLLFFGVYPKRVREEEQTLEKYFGDAYREFCRQRSRFLPRLKPLVRPDADRFEWARYLKNREHNASVGFLSGFLFLMVKMYLDPLATFLRDFSRSLGSLVGL